MRSDLINAFRGLRASPGMTLMAWAMLTLAIGSAAVTFSVVDHVAVRALPFPASDRLIAMSAIGTRSPQPGPVAPQEYYSWQAEASTLQSIGAVAGWSTLRLTSGETTTPLVTYRATASLFDVLRVRPVLGQTFGTEHEQPGSDGVAMLSDGAWRRHFNGDRGVIGRTVTFGRDTRTIVGVMPPGFTYPVGPADPTDVWIPFVPRPGERDHASRGRSYMMQVAGRLRDDASFDQARTQIDGISTRLATENPTFWKELRISVTSLHERVVGRVKGWMLLVLAAVLLVLLVACANVANLLLARATARRREFAVRLALGASPARILRTAVLESLMLVSAAAAAGLVATIWGLELAMTMLPAGLPRASSIALDARVFGAAIAATGLTGLLMGVVPAWQASRVDLVSTLKGAFSYGRSSRVSSRWRAALVVAEVTLVTALVFTAALFMTSFQRVISKNMGFDYRDRIAVSVPVRSVASVPAEDRPRATQALFDDVLDRVSRVPGVRHAAIIDGGVPLAGGMVSYNVRPAGSDVMVDANVHAVSPGYLDAVGLRLIAGRFLSDEDRAGAPFAVVLNDIAARQLFGSEPATGRAVTWFGKDQPWSVAGVVAAKQMSGPESRPRPELYVSVAQGLVTFGGFGTPTIVAHGEGSAETIAPAIIAALAPLQAPGAPPPVLQYLEANFRRLTADRRFSAGMMTVFGTLALLIGALGVYSVMAFLVAERTRDIGVRMALGAARGRILRLVLAQSCRYIGLGLVLGLGAAMASARILTSVLFGVEPTEWVIYVVVAAVVAIAGLAAAIVPAARATRVDPLITLRQE